MFRAIIYFIFIFLSIFFGDARRYRRTYWRRNDFNKVLYDFIKTRIRRALALRSCSRFLTKYKNIYTLQNKKVTFIYNEKNMEISCCERGSKHRKTTVSLQDQQDIIDTDILKSTFRQVFDEICSAFDENANYDGIKEYLNSNFYVVNSTDKTDSVLAPAKMTQYVDEYIELRDNHYEKQYKKPKEKIDINKASEEELAKLPGINIILAKKIVQYRNLNSGFTSVDEFYSKMKIKPHFQEQLKTLISISDFEWEEDKNEDSERIIDL